MNKLPQSFYTSEFKAQAVEQAKAQGTSVAARALGLRPQTLGHCPCQVFPYSRLCGFY